MSFFATRLPADWAWEPISRCYRITKKPKDRVYANLETIPFVPMDSVPLNGREEVRFELRRPTEIASGTYFEKGDVLLSKITPSFENGKQALANNIPTPFGVASTEIIPLQATTPEACHRFLFFYLLHPEVRAALVGKMEGSTGRQRVPEGAVRELPVPMPPKPVQEKIAAVLWKVQRAIQIEERLVAGARELKQSAMRQLFTHGLRSEAQRETEIGLIPQSWRIAECDSVCDMITVGIVVKPASHYVENAVPAFRSLNIRQDRLDTNKLVFISKGANDTILSKSRLRTDDVLVVRTGYPGTSCVVPPEYNGTNCIDLVIVRPKRSIVLSAFLSRFFNSESGASQALRSSTGLAQQHLNVGAVKRTLVPVPTIAEQKEIVSILHTIDQKTSIHERKRAALSDLFQTLLHQLMTAQIRVDKLDIDTSELTTAPNRNDQ